MDVQKILLDFSQYLIEHEGKFDHVSEAFDLIAPEVNLGGIIMERKDLPDFAKNALPELDGDIVYCRDGLFLTGAPTEEFSFNIPDIDLIEKMDRRPRGPEGKRTIPFRQGMLGAGEKMEEPLETPMVPLRFQVFVIPGHDSFSEEERNVLHICFNIIMNYVGRLVASNRLKNSKLTSYLTGLPNAGGYLPYLRQYMEDGTLQDYNSYYFNLRGFSLVNRRFGNDEGNEIIKRYAAALDAFADHGEVVGHLGGDNFVALIRKEKTGDFLKMICEKGVLTYGEKGGFRSPLKVFATAGVLEIDGDIKEFGQVISMAASALAIAKNVVHKPYVFMSKELQEQSIREKQLIVRFPNALRAGEFIPYYQSVVDVDKNEIVGAEVFSRWLYDGRMMEAKEYIRNLETDDSINTLDYFMLEQVCKDINRIRNAGDIKPVPVAVNFSLKHLDEPEVVKNILDLLEKYQIPKELIIIEMKESVDQQESKRMMVFVKKAKEYGIRLCIDDFGSVYSSLNLFREHSADYLKIDKTYVRAGLDSETDKIMLNNTVRLAGELSVPAVAEGIETQEQLEFMRSLGCNLMQGYLIDRPMPIEGFLAKLKSGKIIG